MVRAVFAPPSPKVNLIQFKQNWQKIKNELGVVTDIIIITPNIFNLQGVKSCQNLNHIIMKKT
jgi:hypothetical protein